ncbi:hypothetical protein [Actinacidiphila sp. ITFR-21]|nr:hypothetical protein [Streptomyces sp. ITFR-21]WNI14170.1 hypothetical protein RLT57_00585 [Streptomyces sp. ITFR-21]
MPIHHLLNIAVNESPGPGPVMRSIIVVAVVGGVLLAWFVLRGYRDND